MKLSVVVPTMNKVDLLQRTLAALREQDAGSGRRWEVVVVNDGSSDGTAAFLAEMDGHGENPQIRVVSLAQNVGRARARNLGARAARGEYILFLDDDIVAPPGLVRAHLDLLEAFPGRGTIGYAVTAPEVADAPHFAYLDSRGVAKLPEGEAPSRFFVTQNAAVPREAFLSIGGFDEEFSSYGFEDMEVAFRLEDQAGVRFRALLEPVPLHVHHHTLDQYLAKKVECGRHSLLHLARLHPGRIREMQLHHVVDAPGQGSVGPLGGAIRLASLLGLDGILKAFLARWPADGRSHPRWAALHHRLMDLLVLLCFRRGVREGGRLP